MNKPRVVVVSPVLPYDGIPHAGGQYLRSLSRLLAERSHLTVIVPETPTNRAAAGRAGVPATSLVVGGGRGATLRRRAANWVRSNVERRWRAVDPGLQSLALAAALSRPGPARAALERADVVDLQWSESIRLARLVRRINPRARLLGTFHDVQSQLFAREPARSRLDGARWRAATGLARAAEQRGLRALDEVWTFSDKDAVLLGNPRHVRVVHPPLANGSERPGPPPELPGTALFVANFSRAENDQAARWLVTGIWPLVLRRCPDARLRLVGAGVSDALGALVASRPEITVTGYVEDLEAEYAAAWVAVVPLLQGAGVKFKTVEALLHAVPTVTTPVGAEGIDGPELFAACTDDAQALAAGVALAIEHPAQQRGRSAAAQAWARETYGREAFAAAVRSAYGLA